jgi:hypothetical protein
VVNEFIINIKTVFTLNYQTRLLQKYVNMINSDPMESFKKGAKIGLIFGTSIFVFTVGVGTTIYSEDNIFARIGPH